MTTDTDALTEHIARALYENAEYYGPAPTQPPWDWRDDEERGEWTEVAAAVLPIVAEEVRKAKAEAWDEGQHDLYLYYQSEGLAGSEGRNPYSDTETGDSDEHR